MRLLIDKCNNEKCLWHDGVETCDLPATTVHKFDYDHNTGRLWCRISLERDEKKGPE